MKIRISVPFNLFESPYKKNEVYIANYEDWIKELVKENGFNNAYSNYFNEIQDKNLNFKDLISKMPKKVPKIFDLYQKNTDCIDNSQLNEEIKNTEIEIPVGQEILHGGFLSSESFVTQRPLATTTDAQVAFREAEHTELKLNKNRIDINILTVKQSGIKAVVFETENGDFSHEREILFESNLYLRKNSEEEISNNYSMYDSFENKWKTKVYLSKFEIIKNKNI